MVPLRKAEPRVQVAERRTVPVTSWKGDSRTARIAPSREHGYENLIRDRQASLLHLCKEAISEQSLIDRIDVNT